MGLGFRIRLLEIHYSGWHQVTAGKQHKSTDRALSAASSDRAREHKTTQTLNPKPYTLNPKHEHQAVDMVHEQDTDRHLQTKKAQALDPATLVADSIVTP